MSNDADLRKLLEAVRSTLTPEVEAALQASLGGHWKEEIVSKYRLRRGSRDVPWDTYALLRSVLDNWTKAFRGRFPAVARNYVGELLEARNTLAHDHEITDAMLRRARETAALLFDAVGCGQSSSREPRVPPPTPMPSSPVVNGAARRAEQAEDERGRLLLAVERLLAPPVTRSGPWKKVGASWRAGTFAPRIGIGVDALESGQMRVHIFSDESDEDSTLRRLDKLVREGHLPRWPGGVAPVYRRGDKGTRRYFGFHWSRKGGYQEEEELVASLLGWLASIRSQVEG